MNMFIGYEYDLQTMNISPNPQVIPQVVSIKGRCLLVFVAQDFVNLGDRKIFGQPEFVSKLNGK